MLQLDSTRGAAPAEIFGVDEKKARKAFNQVDTDKSGVIEKGELFALLEKIGVSLSPVAFKEYSAAVFHKLDIDKDGVISFEEFVQFYTRVLKSEKLKAKHCAMIEKKFGDAEQTNAAKEAFAAFDKNKNGTIDMSELRSALETLELSLTDAQMDDLTSRVFSKADRSKAQALTFEDFQRFFNQCLADESIRKKYRKKVESKYSKYVAEIEAVFSLLDVDDSGLVSMTELVIMLEHCDMDADYVRDLFHRYDKNQDGQISFEEFMDMVFAEGIRKKTLQLVE